MNETYQIEYSYGVYTRKSSEYEDSQIQSIQRQTEELALLIQRERLVVFQEALCEVRSAFHPGRREFSKLVEWTIQGKVNSWLCWHANRLSRNPVDTGTIIYLMDQGKLHHIRTKDRVYYNTAADKFHLQIDLSTSKRDSDDKSALVKSGILRRHRRGYPNGFPPVGYMLRGQGRSGNSFWVVDPERFKLVQQVFRRYLLGNDSLRSISKYAAEIGLTSPQRKNNGGRPLSMSAIRHRLLGNSVYAGFFFGSDGQRYKLDETLPRALTESSFLRIQKIAASRRNSRDRRVRRGTAAYRSLIVDRIGHPLGIEIKFQLICDCKLKFAYLSRERCPGCGSLISDLDRPTYLTYTYYYSTRDRENRSRIARVVSEKSIDEFIVENVAKRIRISRQLRDWAVAHLNELGDKELGDRENEASIFDEFKIQYESKRRRLRQLYVSGQITEDEFKLDSKELEEIFAERELKIVSRDSWKTDIEKVLDLAVELENILKSDESSAKNQALKDLRLNLTWDGKKLSISKVKTLERLAKTLERAKAKNPAFEPEKCVDTSRRNRVFECVRPILCRGVYGL